jgi:hypothetical protein
METVENSPEVTPLTDLSIPELFEEQVSKYTAETVHSQPVTSFNSAEALTKLVAKEGSRVVAADFGGDKGIARLFEVQNGKLVPIEGFRDDVQGNDGVGYVESLKKTARFAEENNLPFGISWGGPLEESKLVFHPKAKTFYHEMISEFGGDLRAISPTIKASLNDGPAGLISGAVEAYREFKADKVLFIINGGGIGLAVMNEGTIYATEAGHVEGIEQLNSYNQTTACGVFDATYVCVERLGANKAGIEAQWEAQTGQYMRARDIEDRYKEGNQLAAELYDHSALVVAHLLKGAAKVFDIDLSEPTAAIVGHGGAFKFPKYGERISQILGESLGATPHLIMTKDYSDAASNACLDGAAIAALTA